MRLPKQLPSFSECCDLIAAAPKDNSSLYLYSHMREFAAENVTAKTFHWLQDGILHSEVRKYLFYTFLYAHTRKKYPSRIYTEAPPFEVVKQYKPSANYFPFTNLLYGHIQVYRDSLCPRDHTPVCPTSDLTATWYHNVKPIDVPKLGKKLHPFTCIAYDYVLSRPFEMIAPFFDKGPYASKNGVEDTLLCYAEGSSPTFSKDVFFVDNIRPEYVKNCFISRNIRTATKVRRSCLIPPSFSESIAYLQQHKHTPEAVVLTEQLCGLINNRYGWYINAWRLENITPTIAKKQLILTSF